MPNGPNSPSPHAGEGLGSEVRAASAGHKTVTDTLVRKGLLLERARVMRSNPTNAENKHDAARGTHLTAQSLRILYFWNNDILASSQGVAEAILGAIDSSGAQTRADPAPQPLARKGRGAFEGAHNG